ncbi:MAG: hypothetical protein ACT4OS_10485 [Acidimicrobiales bacterium]
MPRRRELNTTAYWYFRACRAAVAGGAGHLSGPFAGFPGDLQVRAIESLLRLPKEVGLPDQRMVIPEMARLARRHPQLDLPDLEAAAAAVLNGWLVLLSPPAARGVLPPVLDEEKLGWEVVDLG